MTTLQQSQEYQQIRAVLRFVAARWWWVRLGQRLLAWLAGSLILFLVLTAAAGFVNLSSGIRTAMLLALVLGPTVTLGLFVIFPLRRRLSAAQAARQIEQNVAGLENRFINAVQLAENGKLFEPELVRRAIDEIARDTSDAPVDRAVLTRRLTWSAGAALAGGAVFTLCIVIAGDRLAYGLTRLLDPSTPGWRGSIRIDEVRPGNVPGQHVKTPLLIGDKLTIEVRASASNPPGAEPRATIFVRKADQEAFEPVPMSVRRPMRDSFSGVYYREFVADRSFDYYVTVGDTSGADRPFSVEVRDVPQVARFAVQPIYPAYLKHEQPAEPLTDGNLDVPAGSSANVEISMIRPIVAAEVVCVAHSPAQGGSGRGDFNSILMSTDDHVTWRGNLPRLSTMQYRIVFRDESGGISGSLPAAVLPLAEGEGRGEVVVARDGSPSPPPPLPAGRGEMFFSVTTRPDDRPSVQILRPGADPMVKPGGSLDVIFQAADDHGLTNVRLMTAKVTGGVDPASYTIAAPRVHHEWKGAELVDGKGHPRKLAKVVGTIRLAAEFVKGDRVAFWIEATDNCQLEGAGGPQTAQSARLVLTVQDPAEILAAQKKIIEQIAAELLELLKEQTDVRAASVALVRHDDAAAIAQTQAFSTSQPAKTLAFSQRAATVRDGQSAFAHHLLRLAKGLIVQFDAETKGVQTSLLVLAYNDSADAKALADGVAALASEDVAKEPVKRLVGRQDRIIYALQSLLGLIGQAEQRTTEASTRPDGADLPPEIRDKWKKLAEDLDKFIEQQRKDIAVTQSLAKKPVDDFTREDMLKLEELAANQEKWEKFLDDKISDFSKLAEQDFSNPALLKELIELKTDVVMAKDALKKKAVEIAVPLEEAGLELAEAMTTHIEKWLPDTPDRDKWSMEEPTDQQDVPMAELPKELEDMVGELMEEEEDLFDEVEDVTSKWTDSLDKGAGWDAMDGPISNMSAQGVTGNRLPNTSEISGRSGEGRTGKSAGEMVEEEATGKGGRNTPTRLSGDPFQKGQVKDSSREPPGGATGGGKISGVAGEGLEGPVPPDLQKDLQRLAQKQAAIRNKAEAVDARFRANNFNNFALSKVITLMRLSEQDLSNYRYQNALRKRSLLVNNLQAQKALLHGEIVVRTDDSPELPDAPRRDLRQVDEDDLPPRYKDLAKEYLKSLNEE